MKTEKTEEPTTTFLTTPVATVIGSVIISVAILVSGGIIQIKGVTGSAKSGTSGQAITPPSQQAAAPAAPDEPTGPVKVSLDDDPVLGDKNAPVTIVEFSDYECPFCKRHFDQTLPELVKNYIDTGKAKLVFRDLPLSFHDPMATTEAIAANCAREQGGDAAYFKFHDEIFKRTTSNGNGLDRAKLDKIALDNGLNETNFKACLDSEKSKDEVAKDLADASAAGATGTPSFVIGKSTDSGEIEGQLLVGAQPYAAFKTIIDQQLK